MRPHGLMGCDELPLKYCCGSQMPVLGLSTPASWGSLRLRTYLRHATSTRGAGASRCVHDMVMRARSRGGAQE